jgi:hypothetical protein
MPCEKSLRVPSCPLWLAIPKIAKHPNHSFHRRDARDDAYDRLRREKSGALIDPVGPIVKERILISTSER